MLGLMSILTSVVYALPPVTNDLLIALDGDDVTTSGSAVTSWNDQSALGGDEDFTAGDSPSLASVSMPNSTTQDVVDFNRRSRGRERRVGAAGRCVERHRISTER